MTDAEAKQVLAICGEVRAALDRVVERLDCIEDNLDRLDAWADGAHPYPERPNLELITGEPNAL